MQLGRDPETYRILMAALLCVMSYKSQSIGGKMDAFAKHVATKYNFIIS